MIAVIPVAGIGSKLKPHTYSQPKPLMPVAGKPILSHIIDQLVEQGVKDFVFVIGYLGERIRDYVLEKYPDLNTEFVVQLGRKGTGHAIWTVKKNIPKDQELLIVLGDTILDIDLKPFLSIEGSAIGIKKVDNPMEFGVAHIDSNNQVTGVVEKPLIPKSNKALVGIYKIAETAQLFRALDHLVKNDITTKNEIQLTDALQILIEKDIPIQGYKVNHWFDCGKKEILLETNALLLKRMEESGKHKRKFRDSIIIPPVWIGEKCTIKHSIIGPNVTIGDGAVIEYSILKDSIIGSETNLENAFLNQSVVGTDSHIKGVSQSLNIGDNTEIEFS